MSNNLLQSFIFWVFAVLSVGSAIGAVRHKSIVYAALFMLMVFLSICGFFILNNADFLAIAQLIIYAVGLTIIMLFAIMFTGDSPMKSDRVSKGSLAIYSIVTVFVFGLLLAAVTFPFRSLSMDGSAGNYLMSVVPQEGSTRTLGQALFQTYGLPFELASILLLVAMMGAIVLAKKRFTDDRTDTPKYSLDTSSHPTAAASKALEARKHLAAGDNGNNKHEETNSTENETVGAR